MNTDIYETIARLERKTIELSRTVERLNRRYDKRPDLTKAGGVYELTNTFTGEKYVGSAANIRTRISTHFSQLRNGTHASPLLQAAFDKYGDDALKPAVLELCDDREERLDREQSYLDREGVYVLNTNRCSRGRTGTPHSDETRRKMGKSKTGEFHPKFKGYYATPWGTYTSPYAAHLACPERAMSHSTVTTYCEKSDTVISRGMFGSSRYLNQNFGEEIVGSTFQQIGFGFVAADYAN